MIGLTWWCAIVAQPSLAQNDSQSVGDLGSNYASLRPEQRRLIDDWFQRFSEVVKKPVKPAEGYENLPLSVKTTFHAVTHALLMIKLTNDSGKSIAGRPWS